MEGQSAKRRRVYSLEPNKVAQAVFTRNYVKYLVPALMKIKEKSYSAEEGNSHCDEYCKNVVKYEVDMAMVLSAQGFAWSNGLKVKLQNQRDHDVNVARSSTSKRVLLDSSSNYPSSKSSKYKGMHPEMKKDLGCSREENIEEDDEDMMKRQLRSLRRLVPGGEGMCDDEQMVAELESYISCLQMQVNILHCLTTETP